MADARTKITELATALGLTGHATLQSALEARPPILEIEPDMWASLDAISRSGKWEEEAETAFANGAYFAAHAGGLNGRVPQRIEWSGGRKMPGDQQVPADLLIDHVYTISCKYRSKVLFNPAPARLFLDHLAVTSRPPGKNWFQEVAPRAHEALYARTVEVLGLEDMAETPVAQTSEQRERLKAALRARGVSGLPREVIREYALLIDRVSRVSAKRWRKTLDDKAEEERMLWRLLRIYSATYFVLGVDERQPMRFRVVTPWEWRQAYEFLSLEVREAGRGQPMVDWSATYRHRASGHRRRVEGHVEIRWSHGPFNNPPEAKIYLDTPHDEVPGYLDLDGRDDGPLYEQQRLINSGL
ncbi:MAG: hypothetical protein F4X38_09610 [Acidimicrobiaceae bacterium]|nr:hypothetical protein [Acidimicrobiaceae bacterium]